MTRVRFPSPAPYIHVLTQYFVEWLRSIAFLLVFRYCFMQKIRQILGSRCQRKSPTGNLMWNEGQISNALTFYTPSARPQVRHPVLQSTTFPNARLSRRFIDEGKWRLSNHPRFT